MNKLIVNLLAIVILPWEAQAQGESNFAHSSPQGIYLYLGNEFPDDFAYRISRKTSARNSEYEEVTVVRQPTSQAQLTENILTYNGLIPNLPLLSTDDSYRLWDHTLRYDDIDSLLVANGAVTYLSLGVAYLDTAAQQGESYQYLVEKVRGGQAFSSQETEPVTYGTIPDFPPVDFFNHHYDSDLSLQMQWLLFERSTVSGFNIYRRDNLQGGFSQLSIPMMATMNVDSTFIIFQDSTVDRFQVYEYYLRPYDHFGNLGEPTDTVKRSSFSDYDFPYLQSFDAVGLENRQMRISWRLDEQKPFIRSIQVMRSMVFDSGFVQIAEVPPTDTVFIDHVPVAMENYYYRLILNGPDEVSIPTMATAGLYEESEQPEPPTNISVEPTETGANLRWEDLQNNVYGFYVYRMQGFSNELEQISSLIHPDTSRQYIYADTSTVLRGNQHYSYAVKTENDGYLLSNFSDTVSVRPNIPTEVSTPTGLRTRKDGKSVYLFWNDLQNVQTDVMGYRVYRQSNRQDSLQLLVEFPATANHFRDTTTEEGYAYRYAIQALDFFGAESSLSRPAQVDLYLNLPVPPSGIKAHSTGDGIRISWGEVRQPRLRQYHLYRYVPGENPLQIAEIPQGQFGYTDQTTQSGKLYFYYLTSVNNAQMEGSSSESVSVRSQ